MRGAQLGDRKIVFPAGPLGQVGSRTAQDPALMLEQPIALLQLTQFGRLLGRDTGPDAGEAAGSPVSIGEGRFISLCVLPAASVVVARQWVDHDVAGLMLLASKVAEFGAPVRLSGGRSAMVHGLIWWPGS
jgi:hypothetical protein